MIRYTREKLLSLRPVPKGGEGLPDVLRALEGSVCVSDAAQDPGECFFGEWLVGWLVLAVVVDIACNAFHLFLSNTVIPSFTHIHTLPNITINSLSLPNTNSLLG